jgi:hypothetical protein
MRCGLLWECPVCALAIKAERAAEVRRTVEWHGAQRAYLLTLTVRHGLGDEFKRVRQGVSKAWRRVQTGEPWKRFKNETGFVGSIRALENTHGAHGWHPHLHVIMLTRELSRDEIERARAWISLRWQRIVRSTLGHEHAPEDRFGCDLRSCRDSQYVTKLGLEVTAPSGKDARCGNRTPLEIARDFTLTGDDDDRVLWLSYCAGISGARMLTWTPGLRRRAGLDEDRSDLEIVEGEANEETEVCTVSARDWDAVKDIPGMPLRLLAAAEEGGANAVEVILRGFHGVPGGGAWRQCNRVHQPAG